MTAAERRDICGEVRNTLTAVLGCLEVGKIDLAMQAAKRALETNEPLFLDLFEQAKAERLPTVH